MRETTRKRWQQLNERRRNSFCLFLFSKTMIYIYIQERHWLMRLSRDQSLCNMRWDESQHCLHNCIQHEERIEDESIKQNRVAQLLHTKGETNEPWLMISLVELSWNCVCVFMRLATLVEPNRARIYYLTRPRSCCCCRCCGVQSRLFYKLLVL